MSFVAATRQGASRFLRTGVAEPAAIKSRQSEFVGLGPDRTHLRMPSSSDRQAALAPSPDSPRAADNFGTPVVVRDKVRSRRSP